jgi:hypothetical protein
MREPMRPATSAGWRGRNGEVLTRSNRSNQQADQFDLPQAMVDAAKREGWSFQWIRTSCFGKSDPANVNAHMENGWRPVPAVRCDGFFHPVGYQGAIERDGLMLVERPLGMTMQAEEDARRAARDQKRKQASQFSNVAAVLDQTGGSNAAFAAADAAHDHRGVARPMLKRTVEGIPESMYPHRDLALGNEE